MKIKNLFVCVIFMSTLSGCVSDVDLNDIDSRMDMDMNLAIPLGSMTFYVNDFIGRERYNRIVVDSDGVYHFIDVVTPKPRTFREIPIDTFRIGKLSLPSHTAGRLSGNGIKEIKAGETASFFVYFDVPKDQIFFPNDAETRVDEMLAKNVYLEVYLSKSGDYLTNIPWEDISVKLISDASDVKNGGIDKFESVELDFREESNQNRIARTTLKTCHIVLTKDDSTFKRSDTVTFILNITMTPKHDIRVTDRNLKASFYLSLENSTYDYIKGYFKQSSEVTGINEEYSLEGDFLTWGNLNKLNVDLLDPKITFFFTHQIAGNRPLYLDIHYLKSVDSTGHEYSAQWNSSDSTRIDIGSLDKNAIKTFPLPDTVRNRSVGTLTRDASNGTLTQLFRYNSDVVANRILYSVSITPENIVQGTTPYPQYILTPNSKIESQFVCDVPFRFNKNADSDYEEVFREIEINKYSVDSLQANEDVPIDTILKSRAHLFFTMYNLLPFEVEGKFVFLDSAERDLTMQIIPDSTENAFVCSCPTAINAESVVFADDVVYLKPTEPTETSVVFTLNDDEFRELAKVKHIRMNVQARNNPYPSCLDTLNNLKVRVGITTNMEAILNFDKKNSNK